MADRQVWRKSWEKVQGGPCRGRQAQDLPALDADEGTGQRARGPEEPGAFLRTNTNENQELWLIGGWAADGESYKTYDEIYKLDTKADMNGAGGAVGRR